MLTNYILVGLLLVLSKGDVFYSINSQKLEAKMVKLHSGNEFRSIKAVLVATVTMFKQVNDDIAQFLNLVAKSSLVLRT
jgi:hypothetical protein